MSSSNSVTISVVIPLFNKAASILKTLQSVIAQTHPADEIIVVDDGSTDQGAALVEHLADTGVQLVRQENQGVSAARNRGVSKANSHYVAFLDADDYWLPEHLETIVALLVRWPEACLASTSHYIKRDGHLFAASSGQIEGWTGVVDRFFKVFADGLSMVNSSTACVHREKFVALGGFPIGVKRGEDIITWSRLALSGVVVHKSIRTAVYNKDAENRSYLSKDEEPPGSLIYLAGLFTSNTLEATTCQDIALLFDRIAFMTTADFYLTGDRVGAYRICQLTYSSGRFKTYLALRGLMLVPLGILRWGKKLRHKRLFDK